ncbi:MAG: hypothetical protein M9945_14345 [Aquamicrobium sp.]|uniref:hypothetical protein n=1 Tax=Aquamicrobium sp. TaxID=1872579 RepID=UPI00349E6D84|nr:hypothetical protein [Aquamicrobium sp.]
MTNPYLERRAKHAIGKSGRASEQRLARQLKAKARPASGAMEGAKGDIDLGAVLMEAKSTTALSMGLKLEWLAKISREARQEGKSPALMISFVTPDGNPVVDGEWVAVPRHVWEDSVG